VLGVAMPITGFVNGRELVTVALAVTLSSRPTTCLFAFLAIVAVTMAHLHRVARPSAALGREDLAALRARGDPGRVAGGVAASGAGWSDAARAPGPG
jgi:hypothetical protein